MLTDRLARIGARPAAAVAIGLAAALLAALSALLPIVGTLEWKLYDQHVRWAADPSAARRDIAIVEIDERSIRELEPFLGRWPWPRLAHARIVEYLARAGARTVVYDVQFSERDRQLGFDVGGETWSGTESDAALAAAVREAGNVVLLADVTFDGTAPDASGVPASGIAAESSAALPLSAGQAAVTGPADPTSGLPGLPAYRPSEALEPRPGVRLPFPELARGARAIGHNLLVLDPDGPVRRHVPFVRAGDVVVLPSLPIAAVIAAEGLSPADVSLTRDAIRLGPYTLPVTTERVPRFGDDSGPQPWSLRGLINFRGPAVLDDGQSTVYPEYSALDVLRSSEQVAEGLPSAIPPATFRDRLVFVGVTASGLHDVFTTPFTAGGKMGGAQLHASVVDQVLASRHVRPARWPARLALIVLAAMLASFAFVLGDVRWGTAGALAGALAAGAAAHWAFRRGLWLPFATPTFGAAIAATGGLAYQYFVEGREKRRVKRLFSSYLSRDVYEQLLADPAAAQLGGRRREMSVLFSDLRGFTTFTEQGAPEAIVAQLNEYFSRMVEVVFAHRGTVDKFVGDMVMALFGAPLDDPDHADHAVSAAIDMALALDDLNRRWAAEGRPPLAVGVGVNTGEMIAGNIGSERIRSYTVIGDAVNLGARLESLNKEYGTTIIVSEGTVSRLKNGYDLRPLGSVVVKGRTRPVDIYEVRVPGRAQPVTGSLPAAEPSAAR